MDKLKENAYWISLGATLVVLVLAAWFLVVARIWGTSGKTIATQGKLLEDRLSSIEMYTKSNFVPTRDYERHLRDGLEVLRNDRNDGVRVYNDRQTSFNEFFGGSSQPLAAGLFASTYQTQLGRLIDDYRTTFGIAAAPESADDPRRKDDPLRPVVSRIENTLITDQNVSIAMKEYWITEAIFRALTKLKIGGLQKIGFPGRSGELREGDEETDEYKLINIQAELEMPLSKLEHLVTELFRDQRVLFTLGGFRAVKLAKHLKPFTAMKQVAVFDNRDQADRARYEDHVPEPAVAITLDLKALDWKVKAELEAKKDDEGEDDDDLEEEDNPGGLPAARAQGRRGRGR